MPWYNPYSWIERWFSAVDEGPLYITDSNYNKKIELDGNKKKEGPVCLINAPNTDISIDEIKITGGWVSLEVRAAKKVHIKKAILTDPANDGIQICCSNVTIDELIYKSEITKIYSDENHPDVVQIFPYGGVDYAIGKIHITNIDVYIRNAQGHAGIHLTEDSDYNNMKIGTESLHYDSTDTDHNLWFSANSLRNSEIGCADANIVNGQGLQVSDRKETGKPIDAIQVAGNFPITIDNDAFTESTYV